MRRGDAGARALLLAGKECEKYRFTKYREVLTKYREFLATKHRERKDKTPTGEKE